MPSKVYRDQKGKLFHDECFDPTETREGYSVVMLDDLMDDDECESCGGVFLSGLEPDDDDDDEDDDNSD